MTNDRGATVFYKEVFFQSLLEAQWAAFLDSVSIEYRYRPARFPLPGPGDLWYERNSSWLNTKGGSKRSLGWIARNYAG